MTSGQKAAGRVLKRFLAVPAVLGVLLLHRRTLLRRARNERKYEMQEANASPSPITIPVEGHLTITPVAQRTEQATKEGKTDQGNNRPFGEDFSTVLLMIAFVLIIGGQLLLAWKKKWNVLSIRIIGISTIAFVGVFAALTVDNQTNAPAVFGLLGTVAGYLIGRGDAAARENNSEDAADRAGSKSDQINPS
jgi:hypothetical protein